MPDQNDKIDPFKWTLLPVQIKKINPNAKLPEKGSEEAAGYDVFACIDNPIQILPHQTVKIGTGLAMSVTKHFWVGVFARSGLATKEGLRPANCVGVIDPDYRGEVMVAIHNDSEKECTIIPNQKIGQLIILPKYEWYIKEVKELPETERGTGGFGSTGI